MYYLSRIHAQLVKHVRTGPIRPCAQLVRSLPSRPEQYALARQDQHPHSLLVSIYQDDHKSRLTSGELPLTEGGINFVNLSEGNDGIGTTEQVIHFLESASSSFVEEEVEDEGIGEAAHGEDEVVLPALRLVWVKSYAE
jgi:hypothetical protein